MFWRPERGEVKFDSGSQERLGAGVYVRRRLEPVRERVHCRIGVRLGEAPSPRPSPGGSDFLGSIHLTLTEAEVDLKPV
jgi:hypothetical protein